jgi:DNA invertase Pin-like site-specific DNA recombinase
MTNYEPGTPHQGKFVIYLRVSTSRQGIDGLGIDAQRSKCFDFLDGGKWKVVGEYIEVESGTKIKRPQLQAALEHCARVGATLIVARLDRLARNVAFVSRLMESGVKFVAADMPHANNLTIHIIAAMAQYESELISERTTAALAAAKRRGKRLGSLEIEAVAAKGRAARTLTSQAHAENVYPVIERIRSFGITTLRDIANELTERKIETPSRQAKIDSGTAIYGKPRWHPQQVSLIIKRVEGE